MSRAKPGKTSPGAPRLRRRSYELPFRSGDILNDMDSSHLRSSLDVLELNVGSVPVLLADSGLMAFDAD